MKKRKYWLWNALLASSIVVLCGGCCLKYLVLNPGGMYGDKNLVEVAMMYLHDPELRRTVHGGETPVVILTPPDTAPVTEPNSQPPAVSVIDTVTAMDDAWFDDALFIGDSRTVGLRDVARSGKADYFCTVGMTVFQAMEARVSDEGFREQTLTELLSRKTYGKIIITLGINECGYSLNSLIEAYQTLLDQIRAAQPGAKIILQSIMMVGRKKAAEASHFQLSNLRRINEEIAGLADGEGIFFIDANEAFTDEEGYLPEEMSADGCHLYGKYVVQWETWIRRAVTKLGI